MTLDESAAAKRASTHYQNGLHCAEAVLLAVIESAGAPDNPLLPRVATCFGGGVARTKEELCGALAGGLMAVGCLHGRERPGQSWNVAVALAGEIRSRFTQFYGSTCCSDILEALGPQENAHLCHELAGETAALVCRVLNDAGT
jgi:C_GCAxxG_C_C family probable redox protein